MHWNCIGLDSLYHRNQIQLIEKNLLGRTNSSKSALKFFRSDSISLELCYKLMKNYYLDKPTNFEELYREMSHGSRQTIKTIIDNAIAKLERKKAKYNISCIIIIKKCYSKIV